MTVESAAEPLISYQQIAALTPAQVREQLAEVIENSAAAAVKLQLLRGQGELKLDGKQIQLTVTSPLEVLLADLPSSLASLALSNDAELQLDLLCAPADYYHHKYQLTRTHSEVLGALPYLNGGKALDLGCGNGRNSLFLNLNGFDVQGYDRNEMSVANLNRIIDVEQLSAIKAELQDLSELEINGDYDFMLSTVVMMFLPPATVPQLISQMQQHTKVGGVNLIVSAMDTEDYPCTVGFPFRFKENELLNYYAGWDIIKYNENVGELHKLDEQGNRIKLRFATLLARNAGA